MTTDTCTLLDFLIHFSENIYYAAIILIMNGVNCCFFLHQPTCFCTDLKYEYLQHSIPVHYVMRNFHTQHVVVIMQNCL